MLAKAVPGQCSLNDFRALFDFLVECARPVLRPETSNVDAEKQRRNREGLAIVAEYISLADRVNSIHPLHQNIK